MSWRHSVFHYYMTVSDGNGKVKGGFAGTPASMSSV